MCKALSEGGQRCHSHAVKAYAAAQSVIARLDRKGITEGEERDLATERLMRAGADLATTEAGLDHLVSTTDTSQYMAGQMDRLLEQTQRGMVLAKMYEGVRSLGIQSDVERLDAADRVSRRAAAIGDALKRNGHALVGAPTAGLAAFSYGSGWPGSVTGTLVGVAIFSAAKDAAGAYSRTSGEKRTATDRVFHEELAARVANSPVELKQAAVVEIEARLAKSGWPDSKVAVSSLHLRRKAGMDRNDHLVGSALAAR